MEIFTIGFTGKSAADFFGLLREAGIRRLIDIRLKNVSQLTGFTKRKDLPFFLQELCGASYIHEPLLAPSPELFSFLIKEGGPWDEYARRFVRLMQERQVQDLISRDWFELPTVLLCAERTAAHCHRRLVVEYLDDHWGDVSPIHL